MRACGDGLVRAGVDAAGDAWGGAGGRAGRRWMRVCVALVGAQAGLDGGAGGGPMACAVPMRGWRRWARWVADAVGRWAALMGVCVGRSDGRAAASMVAWSMGVGGADGGSMGVVAADGVRGAAGRWRAGG
ncbi:alanine and glycine-rich protein-like [Homarus americanus]|uniref:alanine and glycine-rich protein-like n=1 Tax=Homarus americanus TaxID=6706 RepID=UPI001C477B94|nr:alanine and glycine-rich protein-like [Homarus americanus]